MNPQSESIQLMRFFYANVPEEYLRELLDDEASLTESKDLSLSDLFIAQSRIGVFLFVNKRFPELIERFITNTTHATSVPDVVILNWLLASNIRSKFCADLLRHMPEKEIPPATAELGPMYSPQKEPEGSSILRAQLAFCEVVPVCINKEGTTPAAVVNAAKKTLDSIEERKIRNFVAYRWLVWCGRMKRSGVEFNKKLVEELDRFCHEHFSLEARLALKEKVDPF